MTNMMHERATDQVESDQSYEAKHNRAMARLNDGLQVRIITIRYTGPKEPKISELHQQFVRNRSVDMGISRCRFCNPELVPFKCPLCDCEFPDRWRKWLHNVVAPKWCSDRAAKKARKWSQHA